MSVDYAEAEETLFEIVESGRLVFFTGAGASADLLNQQREDFPRWLGLLQKIHQERLRQCNPPADKTLLDQFLDSDSDGQSLIEAASILREGFKDGFHDVVVQNLTPLQPDLQPPDKMALHIQKQDLMLNLHPRGIVTVNVDELHEEHLKRRSLWGKWNFADPLQEDGENKLRKALIEIDHRPFLVKAHGTCGKDIAFDFQTYWRLLSKSPIYQMFMMNLFTNFQIVFLGFNLSDLDFDFFLQSQALAFGEPIREHVALGREPKDKAAQRRAALLSRRFGIKYLWYKEHSEIPEILERAGTTPGARLKSILQRCLDPNDDQARSLAHSDLANLGPAGKHVAVLAVSNEILKLLPGTEANWFPLSEYVYTLGKIDPPLPKDREVCRKILLRSLQETRIKEVAAHAILALEKLALLEDVADLQKLYDQSFWTELNNVPGAPDPFGRIPTYLYALILRLKSKGLATAP